MENLHLIETLEEAAESRFGTDMDSIRGGKVYDLNTDLKRGFVAGAKWQQERMYSEEDMKKCWDSSKRFERPISEGYAPNFNELIEQFKKK